MIESFPFHAANVATENSVKFFLSFIYFYIEIWPPSDRGTWQTIVSIFSGAKTSINNLLYVSMGYIGNVLLWIHALRYLSSKLSKQ